MKMSALWVISVILVVFLLLFYNYLYLVLYAAQISFMPSMVHASLLWPDTSFSFSLSQIQLLLLLLLYICTTECLSIDLVYHSFIFFFPSDAFYFGNIRIYVLWIIEWHWTNREWRVLHRSRPTIQHKIMVIYVTIL